MEEEIIYVHKDYLALLSVPLALFPGVIIGMMIRKRREKVAPATKSSQEAVNQEDNDTNESENKEDAAEADATASQEQPGASSQEQPGASS